MQITQKKKNFHTSKHPSSKLCAFTRSSSSALLTSLSPLSTPFSSCSSTITSCLFPFTLSCPSPFTPPAFSCDLALFFSSSTFFLLKTEVFSSPFSQIPFAKLASIGLSSEKLCVSLAFTCRDAASSPFSREFF